MNDTLIALIGSLTNTFGGSLGWAIVALSLSVRIALLPLTIRLARRARRNQEIMQALQPEIEQVRKRFEKKPERLFQEMRQLYKKHNCSLLDAPTLLGSFVQLPIFGMLYSSIRNSLTSSSVFLWMKNLVAPDFYLTMIILLLTGASVYLMPSASEQMKSTMLIIQLVVTFLIVWKLAAGLGLYWASSSLVGLFQTAWLRYRTVSSKAN